MSEETRWLEKFKNKGRGRKWNFKAKKTKEYKIDYDDYFNPEVSDSEDDYNSGDGEPE